MKINLADYQAVFDHVKQKRWEGNEYVAFLDDNSRLSREELSFFTNSYDVQEFCYEMSTDLDHYDYLSVRSVYRTMEEALRDKSLLIESRGLLDIGAMVSKYHRRLEVADLANNQIINKMNTKNFEYLSDQIKFTGFDEALQDKLKEAILKGEPEFKLNHSTQYGEDVVNAALHFSKSKESDMYFFNSYRLTLEKAAASEKLEQTIYINKSGNITLKEAYNMLDTRAVNKNIANKEGVVSNEWLQLDFTQKTDSGNFKMRRYHQNYGYDLEKILNQYPIRELGHPDYKTNLIDSLKKGNLQVATFQINGVDTKYRIEANPRFKTINIYDQNMQRVDKSVFKSESLSVEQGQRANLEAKKNKQSVNDEGGENKQTGAQKKRAQRALTA